VAMAMEMEMPLEVYYFFTTSVSCMHNNETIHGCIFEHVLINILAVHYHPTMTKLTIQKVMMMSLF
jgi:hypothetical protein